MVSVTNLPSMIRKFITPDFIWNNPYTFPDRPKRGRGMGLRLGHDVQGPGVGDELPARLPRTCRCRTGRSAARGARTSCCRYPTTRCRPTSRSSRWDVQEGAPSRPRRPPAHHRRGGFRAGVEGRRHVRLGEGGLGGGEACTCRRRTPTTSTSTSTSTWARRRRATST